MRRRIRTSFEGKKKKNENVYLGEDSECEKVSQLERVLERKRQKKGKRVRKTGQK